MTYASLLNEQSVERLREIVRHRAAGLRGIPRLDDKATLVKFLADALSIPDSIMEAFSQTNLRDMQVLMYAVIRQGSAPFETMVASVGEEHRTLLHESVQALERLGLAFFQNKGGLVSVVVPPPVQQRTPLPLPLRYHLARVLEKYDATTLTTLFYRLNLPREKGSNQGMRRALIHEYLANVENVKSLVSRLTDDARKMLQYIVDLGGVANLIQVAAKLDTRRRNQLYSFGWSHQWAREAPRNSVEELLVSGLLAIEGNAGWGYGHLVIPGEILEALLGKSLFGIVVLHEPDWQTLPATHAANRHESLVRDITFLMGYLGRTEAGRTNKGTIHKNTLKQFAKSLAIQNLRYASFLYALSREVGLIDVQGRQNFYDATPYGLAWLDEAPDAQLIGLFDVWREQATWAEPFADPLSDSRAYYDYETICEFREAVLALLKEACRANKDAFISLNAFAAKAGFRHWTLFPLEMPSGKITDEEIEEREEADAPAKGRELIRRLVTESLYWLGYTEIARDAQNETYVRLSPLGRAHLLTPPPEIPQAGRKKSVGSEETASVVPVSVLPRIDTFVVQPNLEIYAPPGLAANLLYRLFRVAEPSGSGLLVLSREMLRRAFDRGETTDSLLAFLRQHSTTGVPQNVEYLIKEVGDRHGHIRVGQAGIYLQVRDPLLLKELKAQTKLNIHIREELSDNIALIAADSVEAVLRQLRQAGYFPTSAEGTEKKTAPPAPRRRTPSARPAKSTLSEINTRIDWNALLRKEEQERAAPPPPSPAFPALEPMVGGVSGARDIQALLRHALQHQECLEIDYGRTDVELPEIVRCVLEPSLMTGSMVSGFVRNSGEKKQFNLRYILRARLTGERFEPRSA